MLKYDVTKVRTGKAIGLPYQGSKRKISKQIAAIIAHNYGHERTVYDVFGGGGAVSLELMLNGFKRVIYNDADRGTVKALKHVINCDRQQLYKLVVDRDTFLKIREKEHPTAIDELKLLINSFGNARNNYIYGLDISEHKYQLARAILQEYGGQEIGEYKKTAAYAAGVSGMATDQLKRYIQVEHVARIKGLELINSGSYPGLKIRRRDYKAYSHVKGAVIYCDPPYENADVKGYRVGGFDSAEFYDWCVKMAEHNDVIISSYKVSDPRFHVVHEFKSARSTLSSNGLNTDQTNCERLFMVTKKRRERKRRKRRTVK